MHAERIATVPNERWAEHARKSRKRRQRLRNPALDPAHSRRSATAVAILERRVSVPSLLCNADIQPLARCVSAEHGASRARVIRDDNSSKSAPAGFSEMALMTDELISSV